LRATRDAVVGKAVGVGGGVVAGKGVVVSLGTPSPATARRLLCASAGGVLPGRRVWWRQWPWPSMRLVPCSAGCGPHRLGPSATGGTRPPLWGWWPGRRGRPGGLAVVGRRFNVWWVAGWQGWWSS